MMAIWKIAPALAAGNTVVLKPSDTTPESTLLLAEIAAPFFPKGAFNVVLGQAQVGSKVVSQKPLHSFLLQVQSVQVYKLQLLLRQI